MVKAAEGVEVVDGDLREVVALERLEDVVGEREVAVLPGHELGFHLLFLEFWVLVTTNVHRVGCRRKQCNAK